MNTHMDAYIRAREYLDDCLKALERAQSSTQRGTRLGQLKVRNAEDAVRLAREHVEACSLPDGTYRLRADVKNPTPDRRMRRSFNHREVWPAGMKVFLRTRNAAGTSVRTIGKDSDGICDYEPSFALLLAELEPVEETPSDYIERTFATDAANILDKLFAGGAITMAQVKDAILACNEEYDAKRKSEIPQGAVAGEADEAL